MDSRIYVCMCMLERVNLLIPNMVIQTALLVYSHMENDPF